MVYLLSVCLLASFFHGWSADAADHLAPVAAVSLINDGGGTHDRTPPDAPIHADHCLSHVVGDLARDVAIVPALFGSRAFGLRQDRPPMRVATPSPFKPPKA